MPTSPIPEHLQLPAAWSGPVAARLNRLITDLQHAYTPAAVEAAWQDCLDEVPALLSLMSLPAIQKFFESGMGSYAVAGLLASALNLRKSALSAENSISPSAAISFAPFEDAAAAIAARQPIASLARTAEGAW